MGEAGFPDGAVGKNPPANAGEIDSIPGSGRSSGGRNGNPLQYSCLENPVDRGAWWATVHGVSKSGTRLSDRAQGRSKATREIIFDCEPIKFGVGIGRKKRKPKAQKRKSKERSHQREFQTEKTLNNVSSAEIPRRLTTEKNSY